MTLTACGDLVNATKSLIDESLYSRQLYVLGREGMHKMQESDVLVVGLGGLGVEVAKNIILSGVRSVTLFDKTICTARDLSSQYFLREKDIGKERASACLCALAELNQYVKVSTLQEDSLLSALESFTLVITTTCDIREQLEINDECRKRGISFISCQVAGLFAHVFCDFGADHLVVDSTGEPCNSGIISNIATDGVVTCHEDSKHSLEDGDLVVFREIRPFPLLSDCDPLSVRVINRDSFLISLPANSPAYLGGGIFQQVKRKHHLHFASLLQSLNSPQFIPSDFAKIERQVPILELFKGLSEFRYTHSRFPRQEDLEVFSKILQEEVPESLAIQFLRGCACVISPMCSVIGGLVAQEALKACTGKFMPLMQHMAFDALECLPKFHSPTIASSLNNRYGDLIELFGDSFVDRLHSCKLFLVGAGAIGCEMLKCWTTLGLGRKLEVGAISVTDMDTIEKSNLNRQFLFRSHDIGKGKAVVAAAACTRMNSDFRVLPFQDRVAVETEDVFNEDFFAPLDAVVNALDNVAARQYMDSRCIRFSLPLLESGTLGTKGNVQVVLPFQTESYASSADAPERSIPSCTIRNFPSQIEHTVTWALSYFRDLFFTAPLAVNNFISSRKFENSVTSETLVGILELLQTRPKTLGECVSWALGKFQELFFNSISQLLHSFPPDSTTTTGQPFWSGTKRCPTAIEFNVADPVHFSFVKSAAILYSRCFALSEEQYQTIDSVIMDVVENWTSLPFTPNSHLKIATSDDQLANGKTEFDQQKEIISLKEQIFLLSKEATRMHPEEFEKDDDSNFHIAFIAAAANLRARNYAIEETDSLTVKQIAGKIIPAIATTTSMVVGLVCLELLKVLDSTSKDSQERRQMGDYKNSFVNLALPFIGQSEPIAAPVVKHLTHSWTLWDFIRAPPSISFQGLLDFFAKSYSLSITSIFYGSIILYSKFSFAGPQRGPEWLALEVSEFIRKATKKEFAAHCRSIVLVAMAVLLEDEDADVDVPPILYPLK